MKVTCALALTMIVFASAEAMSQTKPWPSDPPAAQKQTAPWPTDRPQQQAAPWPSDRPQQQQQPAPWPSNRGQADTPAPGPMSTPPSGQMPPCVAQFMGHRQKVEKAGATAQAASQRKATREEMCKHVAALFNAEAAWIKFSKANMTSCGIPADAIKQIETSHAHIGKVRKQVCSAAPAQAGPAAPSLSDALGTTRVPTPETTKTGRGTLDTLTGNAIAR